MRVRLGHGPRWVAAATCSALLTAGGLSACDTGQAASAPTNPSHASTSSDDTIDLRLLQLNLCNSGRAACYTGGDAVDLAVGLVHDHRPDVVTLNEICRDDVTVFERAMSAAHPTTTVAAAFAPAPNRLTHSPVTCRNGEDFGDGVLVAVPRSQAAATGTRSRSGVYPVQDPADPEERVWVCIDVPTRFTACTTHAASTDSTVALRQCRHFLTSVVPGAVRADHGVPLILGADLNLPATGSPGVQSCLPTGYQRTDDGGVQHVVTSPSAELRSRTVIDMQGTTDHPGLLVDVALPRP